LFSGLGTNNELWSGVATQYCEGVATGATSCPANSAHVAYPTGGALAGIWDDSATAVPANATGHQIGVEAVNAAAHFGNTTAASNRNAQYVIVSPKGTHPDGFNTATGNFCAWHDFNGDSTLPGGPVSSPYGDIAFTNLPYIPDAGSSCGASYVNTGPTGPLDGVTIVEGHEFSETITDQNPAGGWTDSAGEENADKCAWNGVGGTGGAQNVAFANGSFAMQATWSNDSASCRISHPIVTNGGTTNDFSISESPMSRSVVRGSATTTTVSTAVVAGARADGDADRRRPPCGRDRFVLTRVGDRRQRIDAHDRDDERDAHRNVRNHDHRFRRVGITLEQLLADRDGARIERLLDQRVADVRVRGRGRFADRNDFDRNRLRGGANGCTVGERRSGRCDGIVLARLGDVGRQCNPHDCNQRGHGRGKPMA
jgi:hypothetical protein